MHIGTNKLMKSPNNILITGASSGIGEALAKIYAHPGIVLMLTGRNRQRLSSIAEFCEAAGAVVIAKEIEVENHLAMSDWIDSIQSQHAIDLVIANAGISAGSGGADGETDEQVRRIFDVNITGVLNTIHPAINHMKRQGHGQIAIVSSIAGFRGLPPAPAYSASKAAVKSYGEGLRGSLKKNGIEVSVICPGYVKSRITDANTFPMPFLMTADKAASIIKHALSQNKSRITFPWQMALVSWFLAALPASWTDHFLGRLPKKN
jgi:short-subunit dehydrogenase